MVHKFQVGANRFRTHGGTVIRWLSRIRCKHCAVYDHMIYAHTGTFQQFGIDLIRTILWVRASNRRFNLNETPNFESCSSDTFKIQIFELSMVYRSAGLHIVNGMQVRETINYSYYDYFIPK